MSNIKNNLEEIKKELEGYNPRIIAVSKYVGCDEMVEAYNAGLRDFGENKIQDAIRKRAELPSEVVKNSTWHLIGHLQSNKARKAVENFDYIHSIDSVNIANAVSRCAEEIGKKQKVLLQINISEEETKSGFSKESIIANIPEIIKLNGIEVVGLMGMASYTSDEGLLKEMFTDIKNIGYNLNRDFNLNLNEYSMGMSNDYKIAVQTGSTMIRLGRRLFK